MKHVSIHWIYIDVRSTILWELVIYLKLPFSASITDADRSIIDKLFLQCGVPITRNIDAHVALSGQLFAVLIEAVRFIVPRPANLKEVRGGR